MNGQRDLHRKSDDPSIEIYLKVLLIFHQSNIFSLLKNWKVQNKVTPVI